jgi:signal transduction histidine kinase
MPMLCTAAGLFLGPGGRLLWRSGRQRSRRGLQLVRSPTLSDIPRLVQETHAAGTAIDFAMQVERHDEVPGSLGRDAYRIVQEALINIGKHAPGSRARVRVTGGPGAGLIVSVCNQQQPLSAHPAPTLPGSGAGLLGCRSGWCSPAAAWSTAPTTQATSW